jgi:F-type H+-transporting ATPase subunit delta
MRQSLVATRYAKSLLDLAIEKNELEQCFKDMQLIATTCNENSELIVMLKSPVIRADKKQLILDSIFNKYIGKLSTSLIELITKKKRELYLEQIASAFVALYKKHKNITTAKVSSATALDADLKNKIMAIVKTKATGDVEIIEEVNSDLIGGFVLSIDDTQLDVSVHHQLNQLKKKFSKNPS